MDFFDRLVRFETDFWNAIDSELSRTGQIGLATLQALRVLDRFAGEGRVHDLSRELSITIGAASKLVDRLERAELAHRRPHPDDRRSSLVSLTEAGHAARRTGEKTARQVVSRVVGRSDDVDGLTAAISRLQARLERTSEAVPR